MTTPYKTIINLSILLLGAISIQACAGDNQPSQSKGLATTTISKSSATQKKALIIGVSDYAGSRNDLGGIDRDVARMKKLFESWGFDIQVLYDADSMNTVNYLTKYAKKLNSNDLFAFYYTGHGSHMKDINGDESDGEDETLVLSDGRVNKHLIDDILYQKFNDIKAKKLIFFDSCHSGTVFRSLKGKYQTKSIKPEDVASSFQLSSSKGISKADKINKGEYIAFSSSQDTEESLATPTGSLFTNSISEIFSEDRLKQKPLKEINQILINKVLAYAKETDGKPHHPSISFSKSSLGTGSIQNFINKPNTTITTPLKPSNHTQEGETVQDTLDTMINNRSIKRMALQYNQTNYKSGESVDFTIDTQGDSGYLTVFYVDSNDVTILYPNPYVNPKILNGKYQFSNDLSGGKFQLEAYKNCKTCREEKTVIYTLLSSKPIFDSSAIRSKDGLISFAKDSKKSKVVTRAVRVKASSKSNKKFQPQLGKYEFIVK